MERSFTVKYLLFLDWISTSVCWLLFYSLRKVYIEKSDFQVDNSFYWGLMAIPLFWMLIYYLLGTYHDVKRLYRIKILSLTVQATILGSVTIFFIFLLDDRITEYQQYYSLFFILTTLHFGCVLPPRLLFGTILVSRIHSGKDAFVTLLIGGSERAVQIYDEITAEPKRVHKFVGFVYMNDDNRHLDHRLPCLGRLDDLESILREYQVEEVIIALESVEHEKLQSIISRVGRGGGISVKILPDMYDILSGSVKMTNLFGVLLIDVSSQMMPVWQQAVKRFFDVTISLIALFIFIPLYFFVAIAVKISSPGPIFFLQERVGLNGRLFKIIKFRTMYVDAEKKGPQLSSATDARVTRPGRFLRKSRLDEFPQFVNVLLGDMSLVGPRPERQYYIDQIVPIEAQFLHLTRVRPGITSWGQVKYGYAENIDQMLQRMKYDLLYLKNQTLALDFKIMLHTILIVLKGKGK